MERVTVNPKFRRRFGLYLIATVHHLHDQLTFDAIYDLGVEVIFVGARLRQASFDNGFGQCLQIR